MVANRSILSSGSYFPANTNNILKYNVKVFADVTEVHVLNLPKAYAHHGIKQNLAGFSNRSRRNMIMFLAKEPETPDLFCTLTYSDDTVEYAYLDMHKHFEAFRKRMERAYTGIRAVWRIEFVPRKSGRFRGEFKPHFHLIVWLPDWITPAQKSAILANYGEKWRVAWHEIIKSTDKNHLSKYGCVVEPVRDRQHAYRYTAKYMAKEELETLEVGRRWGRIGQFDEIIEADTELTMREYIHFKRLIARYIKHKSPKFYKQFRRMSTWVGCAALGIGWMSQLAPDGTRTIYRMLRHARQLAKQELDELRKIVNVRE